MQLEAAHANACALEGTLRAEQMAHARSELAVRTGEQALAAAHAERANLEDSLERCVPRLSSSPPTS